jgi:hypothetical protein
LQVEADQPRVAREREQVEAGAVEVQGLRVHRVRLRVPVVVEQQPEARAAVGGGRCAHVRRRLCGRVGGLSFGDVPGKA